MKAYTDLSQSKKLAEILPLESADMCYVNDGTAIKIDANSYSVCYSMWKDSVVQIIPCWSLAALLNILAKQDFIIKSYERNDGYHYNINIPSRHCKIWFSSLLDAAFEMVCWLKKNGK